MIKEGLVAEKIKYIQKVYFKSYVTHKYRKYMLIIKYSNKRKEEGKKSVPTCTPLATTLHTAATLR